MPIPSQKIDGLTETTTISIGDLVYVERDPASTKLDRKIKLENLAAVLFANYITAASMTVDNGTLTSGTVTTTQTKDGTSVQVTEDAGADPLTVRFAFSNVTKLFGLLCFAHYDGGAGHEVHLEIYNVNTSGWEKLSEIADETIFSWYNISLYNHANYINSGSVEIRFNHVDSGIITHNLYIDYIALIGL